MSKKIIAATKQELHINDKHLTALYKNITSYVDSARLAVQRTVDTEIVKAYWLIGGYVHIML